MPEHGPASGQTTDKPQGPGSPTPVEAQLRALAAAVPGSYVVAGPDPLGRRRWTAAPWATGEVGAWIARIRTEDRAAARAAADRAAASGTAFEAEYGLDDPPGTRLFDRAVAVRGACGDIVEWRGAARETDPSAAGQPVKDANGPVRSLLDLLPIAFYVQEVRPERIDDRFLINERLRATLGYPAAAWKDGRRLWEGIVHPDDRAAVAAAEAESDRTGAPFAAEYRLLAADGRAVWVRDEATSIGPTGDGGWLWRGVMLDISGEREAAAAARVNDAWFRALVQHSHDLVVVLDRHGMRRYVSPSARRLLGYDPAELAGQSGLSLVHPDDLPALREAIARCVATGADTPPLELRFRRRDGGWAVFEAVGANLLHEPDIAGIVFNSRDITERRRLEDSRRLLAAAVEAADDAVIGRDPDGVVVSWNPAAERLYGYAAHEMIGQSVYRLTPPEYVAEARGYDLRAIAGDRLPPAECVRLRKDGVRFDVAYTLAAIRDDRAVVVGGVAIERDITGQKRTVSALRAEQERLRALIDAAPDGVLITDRSGSITDLNPAAERILRATRDAVLGRRLSVFLAPPGEHPTVGSGASPLGREDGRWSATPGARADGGAFPAEVARSSLRVGDGSSAVVFLRDLSERGERAGAGDGAVVRDRDAFAATPIAVALVDGEGIVTQANRALGVLLDRDPDELVGHPFAGVVHPEDRSAVLADLARLLAGTADDIDQPCRLLPNGGRPVPVRCAMSPVLGGGGRPAGVVVHALDPAARNAGARSTGEFVATVSHELRTPLTAVAGFIDLLLDGAAGEVGERAREFLVVAQANADRLGALLDDLLDLSRIETGSLILHRRPVEIGACIDDAVAAVAPRIEARRQRLSVCVPSNLPGVEADPVRLVQVVTNLLTNANKYTPDGGEIAVTAGLDGAAVRIQVRDSGVGLDEQEQRRAFDRFYRAPGAARSEVGGTGLGLAIARSLVALHGGEMGVASAPGRGATFWFTVPLAAPGECGPLPPEQAATTDPDAAPANPAPIAGRPAGARGADRR